jgi:hypothetical protein
LEARRLIEIERVGNALRMLVDLRRERVFLLRHVAEFLEQRQITVRLDVALRARIAIPVPGAAEVPPASMMRKLFRPASRNRAPANNPPKPPPMITMSISSVSGSRAEARLHVRIVDEVRELAGDLDILIVTFGAIRLSRSWRYFSRSASGSKPRLEY